MRHKKKGRKLGVVTKHRKAMLRNMVTDFFRYGRIKTTDTRAKELRRFAEKIITIAKEGTLHARRQVAALLRDKGVLKKLFDEIAPKYKDRPGGYTRIIKLGVRRGDSSPISMLELVEEELKPKRKKKSKETTQRQAPATETTEAKSRKKEAAEELGLIEADKKTDQGSLEGSKQEEGEPTQSNRESQQ